MSDDDLLELTILCGDLADKTFSNSQQSRLNELLKGSEEARQFYIRYSSQSASLFAYAAEMQSEIPSPVATNSNKLWWIGTATAAALMLGGLLFWLRHEVAEPVASSPLVAMMTGTKDCVWSGINLQPGESLQAGQRLDLAKGVAEITFDSGAQVTMEGPASLVVTSAWNAALANGAVKATVPEQAMGFRLSNPSVEVMDLGTEFSMIADEHGAEVLVLKGSVEVSSHEEPKPIVMLENESRRFANDGACEVRDREKKFARFAKVVQLDRAHLASDYAHWSFDESDGTALMAEVRHKKKNPTRAKIDANTPLTLVDGRWQKALTFDGHILAKADLPGISAPSLARTLSFWVRVPDKASLKSGSTSIIGWGQRSKKHGSQAARIAWNKLPADGPIGGIRTELGRSLIVGSTNIRDGRWHHVAIAFVPDASSVLQVKQYVDGRLDGVSSNNAHSSRAVEIAMDTLWLGCGPMDRTKDGFFVGALDELFVFERALSPSEIVRLMHNNQPEAELAEAL